MSLRVFRLIAVGFLLAAVAYFVSGNVSELQSLRGLESGSLLLVSILILVSTMLYAHSMFVYVDVLMPSSLTRSGWQSLVFASRLLNYTLPQGANIYRGSFLKKRFDLPLATYIGMVLFHSWLFATLTFWTSAVLLTFVHAERKVVLACYVIAVAATLVAALARLKIPVRSESTGIGWISSRLAALSETLARLGRHWRASFVVLLVVVVTFFMTAVSVYLLLEQLTGESSVQVAVFLSIIFTLNRFVNIVPANLGLTELLTGAAYEFMGGSLVTGILVSGVLRLLEFIVAMVLGGFSILFFDHRPQADDDKRLS